MKNIFAKLLGVISLLLFAIAILMGIFLYRNYDGSTPEKYSLAFVRMSEFVVAGAVIGLISLFMRKKNIHKVIDVIPIYEGQSDTKMCPFCAELILAKAIKCKHCGSDLHEKSKN